MSPDPGPRRGVAGGFVGDTQRAVTHCLAQASRAGGGEMQNQGRLPGGVAVRASSGSGKGFTWAASAGKGI